jgi:hypothetical protein
MSNLFFTYIKSLALIRALIFEYGEALIILPHSIYELISPIKQNTM